MMKFRVIALNQRPQFQCMGSTNVFISQADDHLEPMDDLAIFSSKTYGQIFGKPRSKTTKAQKLISIVRITNPKNNETIRRRYKCMGIKGVGNTDVVLSPNSVRLLCEENNADVVGNEVEVCKGTLWDSIVFYWEHPFHATRISFQLGLPALILSIISLVLTLYC
ncbi:MAG: hypothetical protein J6A66_07120 [Alistipes sp.]|nr:hypothetical protein [Alistipes sp.]